MSVTFYAVGPKNIEGPNFANSNAAVMLDLLRLPSGELSGQVTLPEFRRAIIYARATIDRRAGKFTRPEETGPNWLSFGIDADGIKRRLELLAAFAQEAAAAGNVELVTWG